MTDDQRTLICQALAYQALADHLGDVRDAEEHLYVALGISREELREAYLEEGSPLEVLRSLATTHRLPVPDYVLED